jgi:hypothetical protein
MLVFAEARGAALSLDNPTWGVVRLVAYAFHSDLLKSFDGNPHVIT